MMKFKKTLIIEWNIKKEILISLYNDLNLNRFRYTQISNPSHVEFLQKNVHYVLLNFASRNYLLYFRIFNGKKSCVLIERKTLDFKPRSMDDVARKAQLFSLEFGNLIHINPDIYKGTLLDVKMVNNTFQVYNVFLWKGKDTTNISSLENFRLLNNEKIEVINEVVIYNYSQLHEVKNIIENDSKISGIIFIPKIPGNQMIFLNNTNQSNSNTIITSTIKHPIVEESSFYIHKTDFQDAYFLSKEIKGRDKHLAYIPGIKESETCRKWFKNNNNALLVQCIYRDDLNKWIPEKLL